jgi:hypothetical protein
MNSPARSVGKSHLKVLRIGSSLGLRNRRPCLQARNIEKIKRPEKPVIGFCSFSGIKYLPVDKFLGLAHLLGISSACCMIVDGTMISTNKKMEGI